MERYFQVFLKCSEIMNEIYVHLFCCFMELTVNNLQNMEWYTEACSELKWNVFQK